ncbi:MAG: Hpt domain-containing protein [Lachnospiraceae bacterium]|nr:Hpt domain-containing protein [Lachnospiraceae bacterium]
MDGRIEALREWGCSVDRALKRMLGDEAMYLEFLMEFTNEPAFDMLSVAIKEGKQKEAFENAHMLKGVIANLGLDPLYGEMYDITEALRGEGADMEAVREKYEEVAAAYANYVRIMGESA